MAKTHSPSVSRLKELYAARALAFGDFTLASGQKSTYYINSKKILLYSAAVAALAEALYEATQDLTIQAVGGLEVGAIPMAAAAVLGYANHGQTMEGFFVRKQPKDHGSKQQIEGVLSPGDRVAILDDVLTTGESALQAVRVVEAHGCQVVRVVCIVDRLQGAAEKLAGYDFQPLLTIRDFGIETPAAG
jgi:orotate phosphoribosyltransferase